MSDLIALATQMADLKAGDSLPPVEQWQPARRGDIDIVIAHDGVWYHEGSPIARPALVRLFSTVLRREEDGYYLVTPVEKLKLTVEDVPFVAVEMNVTGQGTPAQTLLFRTNVGDEVTAGPDHRLTLRGTPEAIPYLHVRASLDARLSRPVYYQLAELLEGTPAMIRSAGTAFVFQTGEA